MKATKYDMKATKYEMHMNMLALKHLKQVKNEEQKNTDGTIHKQHKKTQGTRHVRYKST